MQTPAWICADGRAVVISAMSNLHIQNARTYLLTGNGPHGQMLRRGCSGFTNAEWVVLFEVELLVRSRRAHGTPT